jgi:hypothetical protein
MSFSVSRTIPSLARVLSVIALSGRAGFEDATFPTTTQQVSPGPFQGCVFGGQTPIVGAHVFVMEALSTGTAPSGYAGTSKSLISKGSLDGTNGFKYVMTDATGSFNVSGDYTCDVGQPVYLYSPGGTPTALMVDELAGKPATVQAVDGRGGDFLGRGFGRQ